MFGIIWSAIVGIGGAISYGRNNIINNELNTKAKNEALNKYYNNENTSGTYTIINKNNILTEVDLLTGYPVQRRINKKNGHIELYVTKDKYKTWQFLRDITDKKIENNILNDNTDNSVIFGMYQGQIEQSIFDMDYIYGNRYIDKKTKNEYVIRIVEKNGEKTFFYMNVKDGHLVRRTDNQIKNDQNGCKNAIPIDDTDNFIMSFNNMQDHNRKELLKLNNNLEMSKKFWFNSSVPYKIGNYKIHGGSYQDDCKIILDDNNINLLIL